MAKSYKARGAALGIEQGEEESTEDYRARVKVLEAEQDTPEGDTPKAAALGVNIAAKADKKAKTTWQDHLRGISGYKP